MPVGDENEDLNIPPGVPLFVVLRLCLVLKGRNHLGQPLALEEARHRADQVELAYTVS
jgi:hypothetical protein